MKRYRLTKTALDDLDEISSYLEEHEGTHIALLMEGRLFDAFERVAGTPSLGHRRRDLSRGQHYFFLVEPYLIVYARDIDPLPIVAVLHSSRDVRKLLRTRSKLT